MTEENGATDFPVLGQGPLILMTYAIALSEAGSATSSFSKIDIPRNTCRLTDLDHPQLYRLGDPLTAVLFKTRRSRYRS